MDINSLFSIFTETPSIRTINSELCEVTLPFMENAVTVCHKPLTFGGRGNLPDELRIQVRYVNNNEAFNVILAGGTAVLLGISDSDDIVCAWKLKESNATQGTISKQVKKGAVEKAKAVGFHRARNVKGEFVCVFRKEFIFFYMENAKWLHDNASMQELNNHPSSISAASEPDERRRIKNGANYLLYGVPGSGKSHTVKAEYCDDEMRMERVVFHPDYTYSDFVGQIMPKLDDENRVYYDFQPGPFTRMLYKAYTTPEKEFFLVIEELNRGNAPAIFGEVFQLLDRKEDSNDGAIGESSYGITNAYVAVIVYGDPIHPVFIPSNLNIVATMNTSDQNVFTLDTAFQRRWRMRMIENNIREAIHADEFILDTTVTWERFNTAINKLILEANSRLSSSEDKRLGAYFVAPSELKYNEDELDETFVPIDGGRPGYSKEEIAKRKGKADEQNRRFPEKVLKYLWDDAFKFSREIIFDIDTYRSLEDVIREFRISRKDARFKKIFKEGVLGDMGE